MHTHTHSVVSLRGVHQNHLGFAASVLEGPRQIPDIEIDSSNIDRTLYTNCISVVHYLLLSLTFSLTPPSPPIAKQLKATKQTVPTVLFGKKKKKESGGGKLG